METAAETSPEKLETRMQESRPTAPAPWEDGEPVWVEPDLEFIRTLCKQGGGSLRKCFQCGTCSATCEISPDLEPFPRKEMVWAAWGMKDRLLKDPDVWLCHQCNDCSTRCPRGARPGDVLAAVRSQSVLHYAVPRFLARWVNQPRYIPLLLGIPALLLGLALLVRDPIENALGISRYSSERIVYSYSSMFPHWLLNGFFMFFSVLVLLAVVAGVIRFWGALKAPIPPGGGVTPAKGLFPSIVAALKSIVTHNNFTLCTKAHPRFLSHFGVFFGFVALSVVTLWVITGKYNPLIQNGFVYPFGFWNPLKLLANLGGAALVAGCLLMIWDRWSDDEQASTFFDWALIGTLLVVAITGFFTELLHYARLEPHRHIAYFIHLVFVFALLIYLPYSKFAHLIYRTTAMVYAEYSGRNGRARPTGTGKKAGR